MAELADALGLGPSVLVTWGFESPRPHGSCSTDVVGNLAYVPQVNPFASGSARTGGRRHCHRVRGVVGAARRVRLAGPGSPAVAKRQGDVRHRRNRRPCTPSTRSPGRRCGRLRSTYPSPPLVADGVVLAGDLQASRHRNRRGPVVGTRRARRRPSSPTVSCSWDRPRREVASSRRSICTRARRCGPRLGARARWSAT